MIFDWIPDCLNQTGIAINSRILIISKQEQNLIKTSGQFENLSNKTRNLNLKVLPPLFEIDVLDLLEKNLKKYIGTKAGYTKLKVWRQNFENLPSKARYIKLKAWRQKFENIPSKDRYIKLKV